MMSYESFLKYKVDTKISALSNLEIAVILWLIYLLIHFVCIEIEIKIQTYVLWKVVINF
jgi:hypothetical protein